MSELPTLIQGARGVRGKYETVATIPARETPLLPSEWIYDTHQRIEAAGYDRCRIKVWIGYASHYITL